MRFRLPSVVVTTAALGIISGCGSDPPPQQSPEDLIRSESFSKLVLEVDHVPGLELRPDVEQVLLAGLGTLVDKPGGVRFDFAPSLESRGADYTWNVSTLEDVADEHFDLEVDDDTIKLHVLLIDGHASKDSDSSRVLGDSWSHTHMAIYAESIQWQCETFESEDPESLCAHAELSVWTHELGHLLGLVNAGTPMVTAHEHERVAGHDANDECVMAFGSTAQHLDRISSQALPGLDLPDLRFDAACLTDLAAVRDR